MESHRELALVVHQAVRWATFVCTESTTAPSSRVSSVFLRDQPPTPRIKIDCKCRKIALVALAESIFMSFDCSIQKVFSSDFLLNKRIFLQTQSFLSHNKYTISSKMIGYFFSQILLLSYFIYSLQLVSMFVMVFLADFHEISVVDNETRN